MSAKESHLYRIFKDGESYATVTATSSAEALRKVKAAGAKIPKGAMAFHVYGPS